MSSTSPNLSVSVLRTLHRLHRQLADVRERLERGPRQIRATEANVTHREAVLEKARAEAKALRMAIDKKQLQLKTGEEKIKDHRRKLNAAASNREYQVLLEQISVDEMTNSVLTDEILEAMEELDVFGKSVAEAEAALDAARRKSAEIHAEVARQEPLLRGDAERLGIELRQAESGLPADIRDLYQRIVRQKGEDALAVVKDQCCGGCNQQVPINLCSQIMLGKPVPCKTCGRLLYMPE